MTRRASGRLVWTLSARLPRPHKYPSVLFSQLSFQVTLCALFCKPTSQKLMVIAKPITERNMLGMLIAACSATAPQGLPPSA